MQRRPIMRTLFVCHGGKSLGLGHVMRARTVARQMARRHAVRLAVLGDSWVDGLLCRSGLAYDLVPGPAAVLTICRDFRPQVVVFDLTQFPEEFFAAVRESVLAVSLSPVFNCLAGLDVVFHRTRYLGEDWPGAGKCPEVHSGLAYAVLRENCRPVPEETYCQSLAQDPLPIVISMGGSDAGNKTLLTLEAMQLVPQRLLLWVLLGEGYSHSYQALVDCVKRDARHEIILAKTTDAMWRVMSQCAVAVLAGGTTTYEAAYAGIPSINLFENGRGLFLVRELVEKGVCLSAGYPFADALRVMAANLAYLAQERHELLAMHRHCKDLLDGQGAARIAREIEELYWAGQPQHGCA
jgi:spore coat polysaccharide biosynthesis protein SpsF